MLDEGDLVVCRKSTRFVEGRRWTSRLRVKVACYFDSAQLSGGEIEGERGRHALEAGRCRIAVGNNRNERRAAQRVSDCARQSVNDQALSREQSTMRKNGPGGPG